MKKKMFKRWNTGWNKETVIEITRIFGIHIGSNMTTTIIKNCNVCDEES